MTLDFEYGINVNNRFLDLTGHDEDPDDFIANQSKNEPAPPKVKGKDAKSASAASSKKPNTAQPGNNAAGGASNKAPKETTNTKLNKDDQRKSAKVSFNEGGQQELRTESARGGNRGTGRRGGHGGTERPTSEGGARGSYGGQRPPRTNRPDSHRQYGEAGGWEKSGDNSGSGMNEGGSGEFRSRGGRGRGTYEVRRGGGRGRGPRGGGRGGFSSNRSDAENQFHSGNTDQETGTFEHHDGGNDDNVRQRPPRRPRYSDNESGQPADGSGDNQFVTAGSGRGGYRQRVFRGNRRYGADETHESGEGVSQTQYRRIRRQSDRERRNEISGVKAVEKKDGGGANNWGNKSENPEETVAAEENDETTTSPSAPTGSSRKDWSTEVDEAEKNQLTFEEYKRQQDELKRLAQEKVPALKPRVAGEGEDPKAWKKFEQVYRKKNDDDASEDEEEEEVEDEDDGQEEYVGKKKVLNIPLTFKDKPITRGTGGSFESHDGPRRGSGAYRGRERDYDSNNDQRTATTEQTGDQTNQGHAQSRNQGSGRGSRGNYPRSEYRRRPFNAARGGQSRSSGGHSAQINLDNPDDFPTLAKQ